MADFSGPIHRNHVSSAILSNAHSLTGKSIYGDVFATPSKLKAPTFSAQVEDYSEIFNSSNSSPASSIPVLDLPAIDKRDVLVNVPKSEHDYSTIFGGFNNIEKDESYEDFTKPENKDCSSGEAWIPSGTSHSESDTDCPEKNQVHSQDATCQSVDCKKQFKMSYHKTNIGIRDGTNGTTHIAQLHALPGFTCMIDEIYPLQRTEGNKPVPSINSVSPTPDIGEGLMKGKHCRKAASNLPDSGSNDVALKCGRNGSCSNGMQLNAYDIDVNACHPKVMQSSSPPPNLVNNDSSSKKGTASKYRTHKSDDFESATDESPIFSDEEVDTNSAAAASAAAVRKAIEMAQASIRLAKEAMEKKKGLQSSMKHCSNNGLKVKNVREIKIAAEAKRIQEKKGQEISEREKTTIQNFPCTYGQNASTGQVAPNLKDWKNYYPARGAAGETNGKQSEALPVMQNKQEGKRELEAAKLSCDFINSGKYGERTLAFEEDIKEEMMQTGDGSDRERWKTTVDTFELSYSDGENSEVVEEAFVVEQFGRKLNAVNEGAQEWENHTDKLKLAENIHEQEEMEKKLKVAQKQVETKGKLKASKEPLESENESTTKKWEHNDYKKGLKESQKQLETEVKLKQAHEGDKIEKRLKEDYEIEDKEREIIELLEQEKYERIVKKACECLEDEKKPTVSCECEVNEKNLKDAHIGQDYDWGLKTVQDQELRHDDRHGGKASENRMKEDFKREGYEKMNETWMQEENDNMLEEAGRREENERKEDAYNWEDIGLKQRHTYQREEDEKNIKATQESLTNKETYHQKTYDACKQTKSDNLCGGGETYRDKENNDNVEATQDVLAHQEGWRMVEESKASSVPEENEEGSNAVDVANELADQETFGQACLDRDAIAGDDDQIETSVEDVSEAFMIDDDEVSVYKENENGLKAVNVSNEQEEKEMLETASLAGDELEHDDIENSIKDERDAFIVDDSGLNLGETNMTTEHKQIDQNNKESGSACDVGAHAEKRTHESGEIRKSAEAAEVAFDQVEEINQIKAAYVDKHWVKNEKKVEASELNSVYEGKGKILEAAQEIKTSQNTEQMKENLKNTRTTEEREANESMHGNVMLEEEHLRNRDEAKEKERERDRLAVERVIREARERALADARERVENTEQMKENLKNTQITEEREARESMHKNVMLEKEHLRNRDEAKEKERERDRLAVERAIREARERAFAEARERAEKAAMEKATAEARQRVQTDVRERLDKAAAGANSLAAKVSMEAKLKAERAAVERATAEARERAMEKALSEKAVFEAREKQNNGMRCSFSSSDQYQGAGPSSSFKHSNSSNYGVPSATERFDDGARNESAERSKARLEKHQRIVQRAAKALEEKNKRDLLAQKEQAERNRFAETLDADVKRWSSGKAGNLRSLLSTLQYILGPNSGWQPIHLTDIVTNTAVKKAYRKATLFVHPDKLQQRGASIQQKYICEKVFDLLKEAWSKFNSEEK